MSTEGMTNAGNSTEKQNKDFTHLHLHSQYSLLDGAIRLADLIPDIKAKGMSSVAVTDHGNMFGVLDFYKRATKGGVKPIIGVEAYIAGKKGRHDRTVRDSSHLVLLAKDNEGYKNLSYIISMGYLEGHYYVPRIDKELLREYSKGLIGLSACLGGVIAKPLRNEGKEAAAKEALEFKEIFAPGDFYLEIQDNGYKEQETLNRFILDLARTYEMPLVATADAHYLKPEDSAAHEILMCIQQNRTLNEYRAKMHHSDKLYVKTPEEMWASFGESAPEALLNTTRIAEQCNVTIDMAGNDNRYYLPQYPVPEGEDTESYFQRLANEGMQWRISEADYDVDQELYQKRLDYELGVISTMGFAGYFLVVWDFINYSRDNDIPVGPGRGSGAGSLVAYSLRITDLDPIPNDLIFERFLNPERISMPDFDIDFCQNRRGEVIDYVVQKYGKKNVGQIVTYSQLSAKSVIKDVGRALDVPFSEINPITKLIPGLINGKKVTIAQALEIEPRLKEIQTEKPVYKEIIRIAQALEGLNRQTGMHAAGIVIGDKPLWEYVPISRGKKGEMITQFAKDEVEEIGLVKFDFLGLKTLTVVDNAVKHIQKRDDDGPLGPNKDLQIDKLPRIDPEVYKLIASGDTDGVFQLESSGFKEMLKRLKPDNFEDIVAGVALYRPGPLDAGMVDDYIDRKHGRKKVTFGHEVLKPILESTYGVIVYQEQVMRIAVDLSGFTMGEADKLRKAMGKKKEDVMAKMQHQFVEGAYTINGMPREQSNALFEQIKKFAGYAFNKSHSAAYAVISYQTAFLKKYYPVEFTAALLSTEMGTQDSVVKYITSARQNGINVLPPDVNRSERDFSVVREDDGTASILFGLGAVKGVGDAAIESIINARRESPMSSLFDFCERVDMRKVNRKVLDALVKSGACDGFNRPRSQLFDAIGRALEAGSSAQKDRLSGQTSLFSAFAAADTSDSASTVTETYADIDEWKDKERLSREKEALGFYVSGHPLDSFAKDLPRLATHTSEAFVQLKKAGSSYKAEYSLGGIVTGYNEKMTKKGDRIAFFNIEDMYGSVEVKAFTKVFAEYGFLLKMDEPLLITGAAGFGDSKGGDDTGEDIATVLRANKIQLLSDARAAQANRVEINVPVYALDNQKLIRLKEILVANSGTTPANLTVTDPDVSETVIDLPENLQVNPTEELLYRVDQLFGEKVIRLG